MPSSTDWFHDAQWGVLTHYLESPASHEQPGSTSSEAWHRRVDSFDVQRLASQLESIGARYYFITLGQNSGHYCSPNATYDSIVGRKPSRCSSRDLFADLYDALAPKNIRLLAYITAGAPEFDALAVEKLHWQRGPHRLAEFQILWESVIREWTTRWGKKLSGWWVDGCFWDEVYSHAQAPNWASLTAALKAGNPDAIIALSKGGCHTPISRHNEFEDFTGGELTNDLPVATWTKGTKWPCSSISRDVAGAQFHILNFLGEWWGQGEPRFPDELTVGYTRYINQHGGVVTWDVPITPDGQIPDPFIRQLQKLNRK